MSHVHLIGVSEPKCDDGKIWRFPYGLPIVAEHLSTTEHTFDIIDTHLNRKSRSEIIDYISEKCQSRFFGISAYSEGYAFTKRMARAIREKRADAVIIVGGLLARSDDVLLQNSEVDICVTAADGQFVLPEILAAYRHDGPELDAQLNSIKGISFKRSDGKIIHTGFRPIMSKDQFRSWDNSPYLLFEDEARQLAAAVNGRDDWPVKGFPLLTSRGCPFECTFCGHMHGRVSLRPKWPAFFDYVEGLMDKYGAKGFYSYDSIFFYNEKEVDEFCRIYAERGSTFTMIVNIRPTFGDPAMFRKMQAHGILVILFGWESGSPMILAAMRKKTNIDDIKRIANDAAEAGICIYGNFLFGMPGETAATVRETRRFIMELEDIFRRQRRIFVERGYDYPCSSAFSHSILMALPTSEVFERAQQQGLIEDMDGYMCCLDREDYSYHYIHRHSKWTGSDLNYSDFSSRAALIGYVGYNVSLIRLVAALKDLKSIPKPLTTVARHGTDTVRHLLKYRFSRLRDIVRAKDIDRVKNITERKKSILDEMSGPVK